MNAAKVLKVNPFFVKDFEVAFRNYPMKKVSTIVSALRTLDVKSKGVGAASTSQHDLLKELLITIFNWFQSIESYKICNFASYRCII